MSRRPLVVATYNIHGCVGTDGCFDPVRVRAVLTGLDADVLLGHMRLDKKNLAGRLRLVLWRGLGRAEVVPDVDESRVLAVLSG